MRTGVPCNENRVFPVKFSHRKIPVITTGVPAMRTGVPCNDNRFFPVRIDLQGVPCKPYRVWVCSVSEMLPNSSWPDIMSTYLLT